MIDDVKQDAEIRMGKSIESFIADLTKVRTGRAHPSLLQHIMVPYYAIGMTPFYVYDFMLWV